MDDRRWEELDAILDAALDLEPERREDFLRERCPDPVDRAKVERLIAAAEDDDDTWSAGGALKGPLGEALATHLDAGEEGRPETIPGYRLLRILGSGGMGHVWEAEQLEPVRRRVAVKILRSGMDTGRVVSRFESERQALALMSHPGIAQVFDAGVADSGRPFFAMEFVDGLPLTRFCDEARLTVRERLRLFVDVCGAVQHAHQKGVIHRDLKDSNVLVTRVDGRPVPKVIDFGIARLVESSRFTGTLLTEAGTVIGTPEYMSPEQAGADPGNVDTRADVYTLGVLMYELLTGRLPFERTGSTPADLAELFREMRDSEPLLPSRRVVALAHDAGATAAARRAETWELERALRDDLDWIAMRALEKDRERRYASVGEFSADVMRYLLDEPVLAGPPGAAYRIRKFARRNSGWLAAVGAIVVALVAGIAGTVTGLVRARDEAREAQTQSSIARAVNEFLNEDLLAAVAPESQGRDVTMREVLDTAAARLEGRFGDQPEVEATLRLTIGDTYLRLGNLDEASTHLERALSLREESLGADHPATLDAMHGLGELRFYQGRTDEAETLIRDSVAGRERVLGPDHPMTLTALSDLGAVMHDQGRLEEAEQHYRDAYTRARATLGDEDSYTLSMLHNLGALLRDLGNLEESKTTLRRALDGSRRVLGREHPETLATLSLLGSVLREGERLDEAEPIQREVLEARTRILGPEHPATLLSANNLAMLLQDLGEFGPAADLLRSTLATQRQVLGDDHDATILSLGNLGAVLTRAGRSGEAEPLLAEALERCARTLGMEHSLCANTLRKQAQCFQARGRNVEAERNLLAAHRILAVSQGELHPNVLQVVEQLVALYEAWGRPAEATDWRVRTRAEPAPS